MLDSAEQPGDGAAGGLGAGLRAFCHAELVSGAKLVMEAAGLEKHLSGADLLITALRTAQITLDIQSCCFRNELSCRSCSTEVMSAQDTAVSNAELYHKFFLRVVSNKCNIQFQHRLFILLPAVYQSI